MNTHFLPHGSVLENSSNRSCDVFTARRSYRIEIKQYNNNISLGNFTTLRDVTWDITLSWGQSWINKPAVKKISDRFLTSCWFVRVSPTCLLNPPWVVTPFCIFSPVGVFCRKRYAECWLLSGFPVVRLLFLAILLNFVSFGWIIQWRFLVKIEYKTMRN